MRRLAKAALGASLLAACAQAPAPGPSPRQITGDPTALVRMVAGRERSTETLTALFRVTVERPDGSRETSRGALAVRRPDQLRLQVFSLGVLTAYDFTADGARYRIRRPIEGHSESGRFDERAESTSGWDLRPLFLGRDRLDEGEVRVEDERVHVRLDEGRGWRRAEIDRSSGLLVAEAWGEGGAARLRARYRDPVLVDGVPLPRRIRVEWITTGIALDIEVTEYHRNRSLDDDTFAIPGAT